jgi:hypothetical protein
MRAAFQNLRTPINWNAHRHERTLASPTEYAARQISLFSSAHGAFMSRTVAQFGAQDNRRSRAVRGS